MTEYYNTLIGDVLGVTNKLSTKKAIIQRNHKLLESALDVIPLKILSCEEGLLESILLANSNIMKGVEAYKPPVKDEGKLLERLKVLDSNSEQLDEQIKTF